MAAPAPGSADTLERLLARDPRDVERILPIDAAQERLTEAHIVPALPELEREFLAIRAVVDSRFQELRDAPGKEWPIPAQALAGYPKGFCLQITQAAAAEFERRTRDAPSAATEAVAAFRRAGGHVTKVWGVLRNQYFQNALQLGSLYFDVANDTVVTTKPKVEYMAMAESGFRNIDSYEEFAEVGERYWECTMYPNRHFPRLAPLFPILKVSKEGLLTLESPAYYMQRLNLDSGFRAAEAFVTASPWAGRALPPEQAAHVQAYKAERLAADARTPDAGVPAAEIAKLCAAYRGSPAYTSREFLSRVLANAARIAIAGG